MRHIAFVFLFRGLRLLLLLALLGGWAGPAAAEFRAGVGRAELNPPEGTPLGGYGGAMFRRAKGVNDPIAAKALVLDDGATRVAVVATDLIGTHPKIKRLVAERVGLPPERLLLSASHTHSGPGAYGEGLFATLVLGQYDAGFFDFLVARIAAAVEAAQADLGPARFGTGAADLPQYNRNRRKGTRTTDPQLAVLRVDRPDGKPLAALVLYAAHGTVLDEKNTLASGDWMGYTQAAIEKAVPGVTALYANGAEGDQSPARHDDLKGFERAERIGAAVAEAALDVYRKIEPRPDLSIQVAAAEVPLPDVPAKLVPGVSGRVLLGAGKTTFIQAIGLNDALLIAVPGEMIAELGLQLKAHARQRGWRLPLVVGLANDHLGYLLTEAEFKKGGYEATVSFFGPQFGDQLTAELKQLVDRLKPPAAPS